MDNATLVADRDYHRSGGSRRRFFVLVTYLLLAATSGFSWLMFSPIEETMIAAYSPVFTSSSLNLLGSWQPIVFLVFTAPAMWLLARRGGLVHSIRIGAITELIGVAFKVMSIVLNPNIVGNTDASAGSGRITLCVVLLNLGQILSAVSSPVASGAPPLLSAEWFPDTERTRATAAGVLANNFGNMAVYLVAPVMVTFATGPHVGASKASAVVPLILFEAVLAAVVFVMTLRLPRLDSVGAASSGGTSASGGILTEMASGRRRSGESDSEDDNAPLVMSHSINNNDSGSERATSDLEFDDPEGDEAEVAEENEAGAVAQTKHLFQVRASVLIMLIYMWVSGAYIAWTALFDDLLIAAHAGLGTEFIGLMSFASNAAYLVAGVLSSIVADVYIQRRMKMLLMICCLGCAVVAYAFSQSIPTHLVVPSPANATAPNASCDAASATTNCTASLVPSSSQPESSEGPTASAGTRAALLLLSGGAGFFSGASAPLFYELLSEVTYPKTSEGIAGIVLSLWESFGSLLMFQISGTLIPKRYVNEAFAIGVLICTVGCALVEEKYRRWEATQGSSIDFDDDGVDRTDDLPALFEDE